MAEMGDSPKQINSTAAPQSASAGATPPDKGLVFNSSEIGTKTAKKQDVFAEHKRKAAEQKAKSKVTRRRVLIFGGLGVILVVGIVILIVWAKQNTPVDGNDPKVIEENQKLLDDITNEAQTKVTTVKNEETGEEEEDDSAAIETYQNAINTAKNKNDANIARIALMQHYFDNGNEDDAIKIGNEIGNPEEMDLLSRYTYYDTMAQAYYELAEYDIAEYYEEKAANLSYEYAKFLFGEQEGE